MFYLVVFIFSKFESNFHVNQLWFGICANAKCPFCFTCQIDTVFATCKLKRGKCLCVCVFELCALLLFYFVNSVSNQINYNPFIWCMLSKRWTIYARDIFKFHFHFDFLNLFILNLCTKLQANTRVSPSRSLSRWLIILFDYVKWINASVLNHGIP